jgi:hypothetical protein
MKTSTSTASKQIKKAEKLTRLRGKAAQSKTASKQKSLPKVAKKKLQSNEKTQKDARGKNLASAKSKE